MRGGVVGLLASVISADRASYNFDFDWKFHLGNVDQSDDAMVMKTVFTTSLLTHYFLVS